MNAVLIVGSITLVVIKQEIFNIHFEYLVQESLDVNS